MLLLLFFEAIFWNILVAAVFFGAGSAGSTAASTGDSCDDAAGVDSAGIVGVVVVVVVGGGAWLGSPEPASSTANISSGNTAVTVPTLPFSRWRDSGDAFHLKFCTSTRWPMLMMTSAHDTLDAPPVGGALDAEGGMRGDSPPGISRDSLACSALR